MWKVTEHKTQRNQQELAVVCIVKEMAVNTFATYADQLIDSFKDRLSEVKRKNSYSADNFYKATQRNLYSIEIWKMTADGEFNYKMFTLDYIK